MFAGLIFLCLTISPIYADPLLDEEWSDEDYFMFQAPGLIIEAPVFEPRSFDDIFPAISRNLRRIAMEGAGLRHAFEKDGFPILRPNPDSGIDLISIVMDKDPSHIIETLVVVPFENRELDILDTYNAMREIEKIKEQTVTLRNGNIINIFNDVTRLESAQRRRPIPDPPAAQILPYTETMYLRFTDNWIGNVYLRSDMNVSLYGITYNMTNFRDIYFSIFRVVRAERISIIIYIEPVIEGVLIYSVSGLALPGFLVDRMNLAPNIDVRITSLINWITDGLKAQDVAAPETDPIPIPNLIPYLLLKSDNSL